MLWIHVPISMASLTREAILILGINNIILWRIDGNIKVKSLLQSSLL